MVRAILAILIMSGSAQAQDMNDGQKAYIKYALAHDSDRINTPVGDLWDIGDISLLQKRPQVEIKHVANDTVKANLHWEKQVVRVTALGVRYTEFEPQVSEPVYVTGVDASKFKEGIHPSQFPDVPYYCYRKNGTSAYLRPVDITDVTPIVERELNKRGYHEFTNKDGKKLRAKLVRFGTTCTLETIEGKTIEVKRRYLSKEDNLWVVQNR